MPSTAPFDGCEPIQFADPAITQYVLSELGPRCQQLSILLPTLLIYALLLLLGVVGNACTCVVIVADRCMHNPTNFYLFSLAVSDIIILILGLPMELHGVLGHSYPYSFSPAICKLRAFLIEFTSYASVTVICAFSVERYFAICFPLRAKLFSTLRRAMTVTFVAWFISFFAALPMALIVEVNRLPLPPGIDNATMALVSSDGITVDNTEFCAMDYRKHQEQKTLIYTSFLIFFMLPAIVMSFMYGHIAYRLRTADMVLTRQRRDASKTSKSRKTVIKVLVSVVLTFFIFWLPFHLQRLLSVYLNDHPELTTSVNVQFVATCLFYISGTCYYSNSVCNPILYNILSEKYRQAFCRTILGERLARKLMPGMTLTTDMRGLSIHSNSNLRRLSGCPTTRNSIAATCRDSVVTIRQYPSEMMGLGRDSLKPDLLIPSITIDSEDGDYLLPAITQISQRI